MNLNTDYTNLTGMSVFDLLDLCDDIKEVQRETERKVRRK